MILDHVLEATHTVAIVIQDHTLDPEDTTGIHILGHTQDLGLVQEVDLLLYPEGRAHLLS